MSSLGGSGAEVEYSWLVEGSCWAARADRVAGEGTGLAASRESGRGRDRDGRAKLRANDARDGKLDDDKDPESGEVGETSSSLIGGAGGGGDGVRGGGGWLSEFFQASRATSSRGSNSFRKSPDSGASFDCGG